MLRISVTKNEAQAKAYFDDELSRGDYYVQDEVIEGRWHGKAAELLGLDGVVTKDTFYRICENKHPTKDKQLTQKTDNANRRIFYDCSFSVPKSVSILYGLTANENILSVFHKAVNETMKEMEENMQVRVRAKGANHDRTTGNMVYALFTHNSARPVDGKCDPQLHVHATVFNASYDGTENKWKATQFNLIKRDAPYYQAAFLNRLACSMKEMGFGIETKPNGQFEIAGFNKELLEKFSRRTEEIEKLAKELGIKDAKAKGELGAKTRKSKLKETTFSLLQKEWVSRLTGNDKEILSGLDKFKDSGNVNDIYKSYDFAVEHCFERQSVITEKKLWESVLKQGVGAVKVEDVKTFDHSKIIKGTHEDGIVVSTLGVLAEENRMLDLARENKGTCAPLCQKDSFFEKLDATRLNEYQKQAVKYLLNSTCRFSLLSGAAGVGKTTLMNEAKKGIEAGGKKVTAVAPSTAATEILSNEGFEAETLQRLLIDKQYQEKIKGQVVILDEAGLVSTKQMKTLFEIAIEKDLRIILAGDTGQHNSVERGDALHILQKTGSLGSFRLEKVVRQRGSYKEAMESLSKGNLAKAFTILDEDLGWIKECKPKEIYDEIANSYIAETKNKNNSVLVVAPTHKDAEGITDKIRTKLKEAKVLDGHIEKTFASVYALNFTEAEKKDTRNYEAGQVLIFQKREKGFKKSEQLEITESSNRGVFLRSGDGKILQLPTHLAGSFSIYGRKNLALCVEDSIRITSNGKTLDDNRLINGANYKIANFTKQGDIILNNGWVLSKDHMFLSHGYVATSHSSQGKTVDKVLVLQDDSAKGAITKEGFYVATSRGRNECRVFTTDKESLKDSIRKSSLRLSATDIAFQKKQSEQKRKKQLNLLQFVNKLRRSAKKAPSKFRETYQNKVSVNPALVSLRKNIKSFIQKPSQPTFRKEQGYASKTVYNGPER